MNLNFAGAPAVMVGVAARTAAAFTLTKVAAAVLGPEEFGRYGHFLMLASYLVTASSFGLTNAFTVYIARLDGAGRDTREIAARSKGVVIIGAATGMMAGAAMTVLLPAQAWNAVLPIVTAEQIPVWAVFCVANGVGAAYLAGLMAQQRHRAYQAITAAVPVVSCAALVVVAAFGEMSAEAAIACYMSGYCIPAVASVMLCQSRPTGTAGVGFRDALKFAAPYVLPGLLIPTVGTMGVLLVRRAVAASVPAYDVGLWQALWRVSEAYMGVLITITSALFVPRLARAATKEDARREIARATVLAFACYAPIAAVWLVMPSVGVRVLLSSDYSAITGLVGVQVVGDVLKILSAVMIVACTALVRPELALFAEVLFSAAFVGLAATLAPLAGAAGAVAAYAAAYAILCVVLMPLVGRTLNRLPAPRDAVAGATAP